MWVTGESCGSLDVLLRRSDVETVWRRGVGFGPVAVSTKVTDGDAVGPDAEADDSDEGDV